MTNPAATIRMLITYAICIPLAVVIGWMTTNPLDYGTLGFFGFVALLIVSPVFIKWHYPIMIFGLGCPMYLFFLQGNPPLSQVVVLLSLGIAIVERALSSDRQFMSIPSVTAPLLFLAGVVLLTAEMTGGIGLHALGAGGGGGKKYIALFIGIGTYFALTSRTIPKKHRKLYIGLFLLAAVPSFISDLFPVLPSPLNYINLLFPPSQSPESGAFSVGTTRLGAFALTAGTIANYVLARYGLRGIFLGGRLWRPVLFISMMILTMLGGFRTTLVFYIMVLTILFFVEKLHRTRFLMVVVLGMMALSGLLIPFSDHLPFTFQRTMSFLPLKWDVEAKMAAADSTLWRQQIWRDLWPQVPAYLLVGKGYSISQQDMEQYIGNGTFSNVGAGMDHSRESLSISGDYHSGPLSTLVPFGIWGAIGIIWLMLIGLRIVYRNFKYGDPDLHTFNTFLFVIYIQSIISFFFIFGAFQNDVGTFAKLIGFSLALNWGIKAAPPQPVFVPRINARAKIKAVPQPQPA